MSDEIEDFIRRAAERRKQQTQAPSRRPPAQQVPRAPLTPPPQVVEAEIVSAELLDEVSQSVASHINTAKFDERTAHLGEDAAMADDRMEARLQKKFDHQVGRLASMPSQEPARSSPTPPVSATGPVTTRELHPSLIAAALRTPQTVRQAIILGEILRPVELDW
jgi:hypothetical protein